MPVEIRELIIKTEIAANISKGLPGIKEKQFDKLRRQLLDECKRMIASTEKRNIHSR